VSELGGCAQKAHQASSLDHLTDTPSLPSSTMPKKTRAVADEDTPSAANGGTTEDTAQQAVLDNVLTVVRRCLAKLKAGELINADLDAECYDQLTPATAQDDSGQEKMTKVFKTFLGTVADALASESAESLGGTGTDEKVVKKMRKKWMKVLKEQFVAIEAEVAEVKKDMMASPGGDHGEDDYDGGNDEQRAQSEIEADVKVKDDAGDEEVADVEVDEDKDKDKDADKNNGEHTSEHNDSDEEDGVDSRASSKRSRSSKKSKKKGKSKKAKRKAEKKKRKKKKRKARELLDEDIYSDEDDILASDDDDMEMNINSMSRQEAKEQFEREKEEILSDVPEETKARFRQCGFATWGKVVYPMIELGPYDVPPGPLRDQWFSMFDNCLQSKRAMTRLIYWYGAESLEEAYSFYQPSKIVDYEKGVEKGKDKVPSSIKKKLDNGKKLSKSEKQIVEGLEQISGDAKLEASERVSWLPSWKEDWEEDDSEEEEEDEEPKKKPEKRKKSKGNKDDDASSSSKKKRKKKGKKRKRTDVDSEDGETDNDASAERQADEGSVQAGEDIADAKKKKKKAKTEPVEEPAEPPDFQVASDDAQDEDFSDEVSSSSEEEEEYVDPSSTGAKKRKRKSDEEPASRREKKSDNGPKPKREKKEASSKKKGPKVNSKAAEQRYFEECEDIFLPLMRKLKIAIGADDMKTCEFCVMKFQKHVGKTTPSFIRVHQFGLVVKNFRKAFKAKGRDDLVNLCHELTKDLKKIYAEKVPLAPEGFEPKMRRSKKKDASSAIKRSKVEEPASDDEVEAGRKSLKSSGGGEVVQSTVVDISKKSTDGSAEEQTTKAAPAERKAFSLKGMFAGPKKTPPPTKEKVANSRSTSTTPTQRSDSATKQIPSWISGPLAANITAPRSADRNLALDFFHDAFSQFPEGKVDVTAASLALESAINDWSMARGDKSDVYWEKTHDIAAALAGPSEPTSLANEILEGKYETPRDLLRITRKRLISYVSNTNT